MNDNRYEDIIHLPHHQSESRPKMSVRDRATQFAPFAALVGYEQMVQETEGVLLVDRRRMLSEDEKSGLDRKMQILQEQIGVYPEIEVTYFTENEKGGAYAVYVGRVRRIEEVLQDTDKFPTELSCAEASVSAPQSIAANITAATAVVDMIYNILTVGETRVRQITFATGSVNMRAILQKTRRKAA